MSTLLDHSYTSASQVIKLANNLAFLTGFLDELAHLLTEFTLLQLREVWITVDSSLSLLQAFAIKGGRPGACFGTHFC